MIGTRLAHYEITERIGEGGMGVVWKATDTTLGRSVAIKVLPEMLARDPERLARLEREARLLAALSHPNIASIYGLHEDHGVRFLAMELAPGENLAARIDRGPLPVEEALAIALRIAEALEHAHEHGIVHRDLKPANVVIGPDGGVKVLDFGLAKAFETDQASGSNPSLTQSPTITAGMTAANVVLGTAAYMSPEQARGHAADKRADIWSFGVVLYEMLTGARMFEGGTVSDVLAAVLRADFEWKRLPDGVSPRVRVLLERCLQRDRRARLRDIGEARIVLAAEIEGAPDPHASALAGSAAGALDGSAAGPRSRLAALAWPIGIGLAALLAGLFIGRGLQRGARPDAPAIPHRIFTLPAGADPALPQISPDGRRVAWLEGDTLLVQELDATDPRRVPLAARVQPSALFWAPDGSELGYLSGSTVRAIDMRTREERQICDAGGAFTSGSGASWGDDGIITMSRAELDGLLQVPAVGGDPRTVSPTDSIISDYHEPSALPGGRGVLFAAHLVAGSYDNIFVFDGRGYREVLKIPGHSVMNPVYSRTGHILYRRTAPNPGVWAVPFSLDRLAATGEPFIVVPDASYPSVADDGTLLFRSGLGETQSDLVVAGADGGIRATVMRVTTPFSVFPALSPDGRRAAVEQVEGDASDIWVCDLDRGTRTRLTFSEGAETIPNWAMDGRSIVYQARGKPGGVWNVLRLAADGSGEPDTLVRGGFLPSLAPDGRTVLYSRMPDGTLCARSLDGGDAQESSVQGMAKAVVSPDGRFVAYVSTESGREEVYMRRFPSFSGKWQVSANGGDWPVWSGRGDRLFFAHDDDVMVVNLALGDAPVLGEPKRLFTRPRLSMRGVPGWSARFGVDAEGTTFVFGIDASVKSVRNTIVLDQNWLAPFEAAGAR